jgi:hypothetical protein
MEEFLALKRIKLLFLLRRIFSIRAANIRNFFLSSVLVAMASCDLTQFRE